MLRWSILLNAYDYTIKYRPGKEIANAEACLKLFKAPGIADCEGGLKALYSISLNIAKKALSYTIGEEIVIPAIKEVIETVMKKDSEPVLKCIPLSAMTVQRRIDEMASDVNTMSPREYYCSGYQWCKSRHRGFATLLKETVPDVRAVHCVLHNHHLVAKNLSEELHAALKKLEEGADVSDRDLEIYINHLEKLREDFKIRFEDLENMTVPDWIIKPFDIEIENANIEFLLQEKHVEMSADLEAKLLFKHKSFSEFWSNVNITTKYPKLSAAAQTFLLAFPSSNLVEAGFSHVNGILSKQRNRLNLEMRGDLRLKLTNFQPNIIALAAAHQTHPSH
ncbi:SCAN domain-containing protein 3 [Trichinella papuae]|uniref:SCAN domain-containing protein 3 n=1 Tax=Trichinella papuae TaxID=268474 RepID=A0A0V1M2Y2_9BILA|nr:SCAN domain-containing protein 3 [Trichinella papuae]